jgi:hypothetical protein
MKICECASPHREIRTCPTLLTENVVTWTNVYELHMLWASFGNAAFDTLYSQSN